MRVLLVALSLAVCGTYLLALPQSPAPAEPQQTESIDFDALRAQAKAGLETLQQSQERVISVAGAKL